MNLRITTWHALLAIIELAAAPDRQMSIAEMAEKTSISCSNLSRALRALGQKGIVSATRGRSGGWRFIGDARRMTLFDIIAVFEEIGLNGADCGKVADGSVIGLALASVLDDVDDGTRTTLSSITVSAMLTSIGDRSGAERRQVITAIGFDACGGRLPPAPRGLVDPRPVRRETGGTV